MIHQNEPLGNSGVTLNGRKVTPEEAAAIRAALGIVATKQVTLKAGETLTVPWGNPALVLTHGDEFDVSFDFMIPEGRPGIDGIGSVDTVEAVGLPYGQAPDVINFGTPERAKLRFYVPAGPPGAPGLNGIGLPANPTEGYVVGFKNGVITWVPQATGTGEVIVNPNPGTGSTTIVNNVYNVGSLLGSYPWETGSVVTPPVDPTPIDPPPVDPNPTPTPTPSTQTVFDTTTFNAARTAANAATLGNKRTAFANSLIQSFGAAQKITIKQGTTPVLTADYTGAMERQVIGDDIAVVLSNMTSVSSIANGANPATGVWTMEISGGAGFVRTMKFPAALDFTTVAGNGFNPGAFTFIIPRSLDGL